MSSNTRIKTLDERSLAAASRKLSKMDPDLALIFETYGTPPLWAREPGFSTLVHIILEQQVSLASAKACHDKLCERLGKLTPKKFLTLDDVELKAVGFSRQKTSYVRNLAEIILARKFSLKALETLPNEAAKEALKQLKGVGDWTADVYLLMCLLRQDVMPRGDIALHAAYQKLKRLDHRPGSDEFIEIAARWKPYRAAAARLLWHFYLSERAKRKK
jgi:DNA-3-methyladenine glycosylase II